VTDAGRLRRAVAPAAAALAVAAAASIAHAAPPQPATEQATLATFAGDWAGHTRALTITRSGHAKESIGDGCCDPIVDLRLRLSRPRGDRHVASVAVRVTFVRIHDPSVYSRSYPAPHVGQRGRLKLRYGVITDSVTGANYCNARAQTRGTCGA
jgi:hypothetical protein